MGSTTPIVKWPYPVSSDLIAQGAVNIEQLAEATESQFFLPKDQCTEADPYTSYPMGMSIMDGSSAGWFAAGLIHTIRAATGQYAFQYFARKTSYASSLTLKTRFTLGDTWSKWDTVVGPGSPEAFASGSVTVPVTGGEVSSATVTFPAGRFEYAPAVFTQYRGGSPGVSTSPAGVTNTSFTLNVQRATSTDSYVYWQAVSNQGE